MTNEQRSTKSMLKKFATEAAGMAALFASPVAALSWSIYRTRFRVFFIAFETIGIAILFDFAIRRDLAALHLYTDDSPLRWQMTRFAWGVAALAI
jgi:hypothetical protein